MSIRFEVANEPSAEVAAAVARNAVKLAERFEGMTAAEFEELVRCVAMGALTFEEGTLEVKATCRTGHGAPEGVQ